MFKDKNYRTESVLFWEARMMNTGTDSAAQGYYPLLKQPATINGEFFQFRCQVLHIPKKLKVARLCSLLSLVQLLVIAAHLGTLQLSPVSRRQT